MRVHALRECLLPALLLAAGTAAADPATDHHPASASATANAGHGDSHGDSEAVSPMPMHAPDPIGIPLVATRLAPPGKLMLAFRYMHMDMRQLVHGDDRLSTRDVASLPNRFGGTPGPGGRPLPPTYRMAPEHMTTDMTMLGAMTGITRDFSVMAMVPYLDKEMSMVTFAGGSGTTPLGSSTSETSGIGDVAVFGAHRLVDSGPHHAHLQLGVSFPTGSITEKGNMLMPSGAGSMRMRLPYGMQLGTGTYDLLPGLTYWGDSGDWSWGLVAAGRLHLGDNAEGYSFGDRAYVTGYGQHQVADGLFFSLRLVQEYTAEIDGRDRDITGTSPMVDPENYGGWKTSSAVGVTYRLPFAALKGTAIGTEVIVPVYQNLNGPQLEDNWAVWAGIRTGFRLPTL